eukprot:TRINITY_DN3707_c0_g1_i1.p1 TRINITY_DN3707_c0_g1~~TRINITY_DN3707_c0_g1_i1.p1  ORF type:complete len:1573 (-),score=763.32 TRINITY_DN3707_c0_g1_i1:256-4872(-)
MATVSQIVAQVIETLSNSISELMLLVISWQEQNAQPPSTLSERVDGVSQAAMLVQNVARQLGDTEYGAYPDIKARVVAAAENVSTANAELKSALAALVSGGTGLEEGWSGLVKAIKEISGETIKLLQIVYGAEKEKIFRAAEEALDALAKVNPDEAATVPKDFVAAVNAAATKAAQLGAMLQGKAQDTDSPVQKQQLIEMGQRLRKDAEGLIGNVNKLLKDPKSADLRGVVVQDLGKLNNTIDEATQLLNEMDHEFDDAHSRFEDASRSMERSLAELERMKLATYAEDILVTAAKEKEATRFLAEDLDDEDPDAARATLERTKGLEERLEKLAQLELGTVKDAGKKRELERIAGELAPAFAAYESAAKAAIAAPGDTGKRQALDRQQAALTQKIENLERFVENPGARLRAMARKEKEDLDKLAVGAEEQDARNVSRAAKAVVAENKDVLAMARRQAGQTEDPVRKRQIMDGCDELERLLPHNIMAAKAVLENPDDSAAVDNLRTRTHDLKAHIDALVENACPHPELELIEAVALEKQLVRTMQSAAKGGDKAKLGQAAPSMHNNTQRISELSKQIVTKFDDRSRKARLIDALSKLDRATKQYDNDAKAMADNPSNPTVCSRVEKGVAEIDRLLQVVLDETEAELFAEALRQKADLAAMRNATNAGDRRTMAETAQTIAKRQANLVAMARANARRTEDPLKRKQMLDDIDGLDFFLSDAVGAAAAAADNPDDEAAKRRLAESVMLMDSLLGDMMAGGGGSGEGTRRGKGSGQEGMNEGLLELQALMPEMMAAARAVASDPSAANRQRMEKILTELELQALNDERGALAAALRDHNANLAELCDAAERGDKAGTTAALAKLQESHTRVVGQARSIASKTEDEVRRKKMLDACDELDMLFPMVGQAANAVAADPQNAQKRDELREVVRRIHHNGNVIAQAACLTPEIVVAQSARREQEALKRLQAACAAGDVPGRDTAFQDVEAANRHLVESARQCAKNIGDPALHKRVMENITELERLMPNLNASTDKAAHNKNDAQAQRKAAEDIVKASHLINRIVADTRANPIAVCQEEDALLQSLAGHITGVSAEAAQDVQAFQKKHVELKEVLAAEMKRMTNPQRKQAIVAAVERMDKFIPHHIQSAMKVLQAPTDNEARENFNTTHLHLRAGLASIIAALRPSLPNVVNNDRQQGKLLLAQLRDTCKRGDEENSEKVLTALGPVSSRIVKAGKEYAAKGGSPSDSKKVLDAANKLEQLQSTVAQVARAARSNPRDAAKQQALAAHTRKMEECFDTIADTVCQPSTSSKDEARRRLNALLASTRSGRIDSQRFLGAASALADHINGLGGAGDLNSNLSSLNKHLTADRALRPKAAGGIDDLLEFLAGIGSEEAFQPKTWDEMINKVAEDVKKAAGRDDSDPIMKHTRLVGLELARIAKAAKEGDRMNMVKGGRDAARAVNALIAILKPLAARCKDPRTKDRLLRTIQAMNNYSTQLQILCAVKAGSAIGDQDADTQGQLVAVARSLGKTLTESVDTVKTMRSAKFI